MVCTRYPWAILTVRTSNEDQIPKPNQQEGLGIGWPASETDMEQLKTYFNEVKAKMQITDESMERAVMYSSGISVNGNSYFIA